MSVRYFVRPSVILAGKLWAVSDVIAGACAQTAGVKGPLAYFATQSEAAGWCAEMNARHAAGTAPDFEIRRHGRFWVLRPLRSVTPEKPETHLGACYASAADARWSALNELAGFDWTRTKEEIMADPYLVATAKWVAAREWSARKPSDQWRREDLRKALVALRAIQATEHASA